MPKTSLFNFGKRKKEALGKHSTTLESVARSMFFYKPNQYPNVEIFRSEFWNSLNVIVFTRAGNNIFVNFKDFSRVGGRVLVGEPVIVTCKVLEESRRREGGELY